MSNIEEKHAKLLNLAKVITQVKNQIEDFKNLINIKRIEPNNKKVNDCSIDELEDEKRSLEYELSNIKVEYLILNNKVVEMVVKN